MNAIRIISKWKEAEERSETTRDKKRRVWVRRKEKSTYSGRRKAQSVLFSLFSIFFSFPSSALFVSSRKLNAMPSIFYLLRSWRGVESAFLLRALVERERNNDTRNTSIDSGVVGEGKTVRSLKFIWIPLKWMFHGRMIFWSIVTRNARDIYIYIYFLSHDTRIPKIFCSRENKTHWTANERIKYFITLFIH